MNEIFNPTLVMSIGPSANKALDFLKDMVEYIPQHFKDSICYESITSFEDLDSRIQTIIDDKLLISKNLNHLVDLGFKVRTENTSSVKINIYVYWDVYNSEININTLLDTIYSLNYGNIDRAKNSGVSLFILPILDKEWNYDISKVEDGIENLRNIISLITSQDNMINIDSKVLLLHSVTNDGTRISKMELEYVSSLLVYLNILPSEQPPLLNFNKRIFKIEEEFKVGTIGISSLTVFKDRLIADIKYHLSKDIIKHAINYEEQVNFEIFNSNEVINTKYAYSQLNKVIPFSNQDEMKLPKDTETSIDLDGKDIQEYPSVFKNWEALIEKKYLTKIKNNIDQNINSLCQEGKKAINKELNSVIARYSLKEGMIFLKYLLEKANNETTGTGLEKPKEISHLNEILKEKVRDYPNPIGFMGKGILLSLFVVYFFINIKSSLAWTNISNFGQVSIMICTLLTIIGLGVLEYFYNIKKFNQFVEEYIDQVYSYGGKLIRYYQEKKVADYIKCLKEHIESELSKYEECVKLLEKDDLINSDVIREYEFKGLINELFNDSDREKFYKETVTDIPGIYSQFIKNINLLNEDDGATSVYSKVINCIDEGGKEFEEIIEKFTEEQANNFVNKDFYEFVKCKWGDSSDSAIDNWIDRSLIKAKGLLQFNKNKELEEHQLFIGSREFNYMYKEKLREKLKNFAINSIQSQDVFSNSISIIRLYLGIELNSITSFINVKWGDKQ